MRRARLTTGGRVAAAGRAAARRRGAVLGAVGRSVDAGRVLPGRPGGVGSAAVPTGLHCAAVRRALDPGAVHSALPAGLPAEVLHHPGGGLGVAGNIRLAGVRSGWSSRRGAGRAAAHRDAAVGAAHRDHSRRGAGRSGRSNHPGAGLGEDRLRDAVRVVGRSSRQGAGRAADRPVRRCRAASDPRDRLRAGERAADRSCRRRGVVRAAGRLGRHCPAGGRSCRLPDAAVGAGHRDVAGRRCTEGVVRRSHPQGVGHGEGRTSIPGSVPVAEDGSVGDARAPPARRGLSYAFPGSAARPFRARARPDRTPEDVSSAPDDRTAPASP
jgi:hypothetical protein